MMLRQVLPARLGLFEQPNRGLTASQGFVPVSATHDRSATQHEHPLIVGEPEMSSVKIGIGQRKKVFRKLVRELRKLPFRPID